MKKSLLILCALVSMLICSASLPAAAATLWYNGDPNLLAPLGNGWSPDSHYATYDDFVVPSGGWTIDTVWSNDSGIDFTTYPVSQAYWEIRSGVSTGNGGTLVASGTDSATQTYKEQGAYGWAVYTIKVTGLKVTLGPGTYWLTVDPIIPSGMMTYVSNTYKVNYVGEPSSLNDNSFFSQISPQPESLFQPVSGSYTDFSMGVAGNAVPLPPSLLLLGSGLLGIAGLGWRRNRN